MSFRGDSFYSYGTVMARHISRHGRRAIILNDTSYSVTTSKHQSLLRRAIPDGVPVFRIGYIGLGCSLNFDGREGKVLFEYAVEQSAECLKSSEHARGRKGRLESAAAEWLEDAREINEFFGLRRKVDEKTIERLKESSERAEREAARKRAEAEEKRRTEQTEAFEAWKRGENTGYYFRTHLFPVTFRIEGEELVSTLGARVPLADARRAMAFVLLKKAEGWSRNGVTMRVGHYQIDSISGDGVKAGCHNITWEEIERLSSILGQVEVIP